MMSLGRSRTSFACFSYLEKEDVALDCIVSAAMPLTGGLDNFSSSCNTVQLHIHLAPTWNVKVVWPPLFLL